MVAYVLIIISQIAAWIILYLEGYTMDVGITIALIGIAGGIWAQVIQFKKDAQRIDGVNKTAGEVKSDTSEIKPKVENIERSTNIIREDITRTVLPKVERLDNIGSNVSELLEAKHVEDALKQKVSVAVTNPDYIQSAVKLIYEKNAALEGRVSELTNDKILLQMKNDELQQENTQLHQKNKDLLKQVKELQRKREDEPER